MTVDLRGVSKHVGPDTHIHDTSLTLQSGGFNVLLGTTLSGKTTLMRLMAGLDVPTTGEVWFDGNNVTGVPVQKRSVAMVYQQFINYPNFNVYKNISSPLKVAGFSKKAIREKVERIAGLLKLESMLDRLPAELSGGQQQRTALARALVKEADLVLLDEPLANLDYKLREELRDELPRLFADTGATVVYATTEPMEAMLLGGHTAALHEGRVTQYGPTSALYRRPADLLTAQAFSDPPMNTAQVRKQGEHFILSDSVRWPAAGSDRALADGEYTLGLRPHHFTLSAAAESVDRQVHINATVMVSEISGSESVVHVDMGMNHANTDRGDTAWVSETRGVHSLEVGAQIPLCFDADRCLYFDEQQQRVSG